MHWVNRGPEPGGLRERDVNYTPRWVDAYVYCIGKKPPSDTYWTDFLGVLKDRFAGLCAYCEEHTKGEVEHFRPKSKFPGLVYSWSNWLFACHDCNHTKLNSWPSGGYVNPCASSDAEWPEEYFDFETQTAYIMPRPGLSPEKRQRAQQTIDDLGLNDDHHWTARLEWLSLFASKLPTDPGNLTTEDRHNIEHFSGRRVQLSSYTRGWLAKHGYPTDGMR